MKAGEVRPDQICPTVKNAGFAWSRVEPAFCAISFPSIGRESLELIERQSLPCARVRHLDETRCDAEFAQAHILLQIEVLVADLLHVAHERGIDAAVAEADE